MLGLVASWDILGSGWLEHRRLVAAYQNGSAKLVEGVVENFVPLPPEGHALESFEVNGKRFEYSKFVVTEGFNGVVDSGSGLRDGLRVRVWYVGGTIVRLETEK